MYFDDYAAMLAETVDRIDRADVEKLYAMIDEARLNGRRVFMLGNGGAAASASHWVCDFGKGINVGDSKRLKMVAPVDNSAIFSALGNDFGYETSLAYQIQNLIEPNDLVICMSVSGSSPNLVEAVKVAKAAGAKTVCIVGDKKGSLIGMCDFPMVIKSQNYGVVEDIHMILAHAISQQMKRANEQGA
ncbi:MAG: SIS domain-containing protein [Oscillospiraceae bacterium]|nr:SIS domain-containing protein [Oscillospiraceae bacterium]